MCVGGGGGGGVKGRALPNQNQVRVQVLGTGAWLTVYPYSVRMVHIPGRLVNRSYIGRTAALCLTAGTPRHTSSAYNGPGRKTWMSVRSLRPYRHTWAYAHHVPEPPLGDKPLDTIPPFDFHYSERTTNHRSKPPVAIFSKYCWQVLPVRYPTVPPM